MGLKDVLNKVREVDPLQLVNYQLTEPIAREELSAILLKYGKILEQRELTDEEKKDYILKLFPSIFSGFPREQGAFHASELSIQTLPCMRQLYYQTYGVPIDPTWTSVGDKDNKTQRIFDIGTFIHLYIQYNLHKAGLLEDFEVRIDGQTMNIKGRGDGKVVINSARYLLEIKSINSFGFSKLRGAKPEHVKQASIYAKSLGYEGIVYMYYCKDSSDIKIYYGEVDQDYCDHVEYLASTVNKAMFANIRKYRRHPDGILVHDTFARVCPSITAERALSCKYAQTCFKAK